MASTTFEDAQAVKGGQTHLLKDHHVQMPMFQCCRQGCLTAHRGFVEVHAKPVLKLLCVHCPA
eukprot:1160731-Pelagomonas_calceolata.AAC.7